MAFRISTFRNAHAFRTKHHVSPPRAVINSTFHQWKNIVGHIVMYETGKNVDDLPDEDYYLMYHARVPPQVMADLVLKNNGY
jgi:hypothetical protein